jgi:hypothetical protein
MSMKNHVSKPSDAPKIGILCWEKGRVPKGLMQLETLVGNSTNPASYSYPVRLCPVLGANVHTILENPDPAVLRTMIADARNMVAGGIKAITTSCGFNAIFQRELAAAVNVPVFSSSLLQVPLVRQMHGPASEICILTAQANALRAEHLTSVGIANASGLHICGLEACQAWNTIFTDPEAEVDLQVIEREVIGTALNALKQNPNIRAFVLECTDLPPFSVAIRNQTGLPVFDFITMINYLHSTL